MALNPSGHPRASTSPGGTFTFQVITGWRRRADSIAPPANAVISTDSLGRAAAESPRARVWRVPSIRIIRAASLSIPSSTAVRSAGSRSGLRRIAPRLACSAVIGVRSSWPASPAKRRVADSASSVAAAEVSRRASIALMLAVSSSISTGLAPGSTRFDRSSVELTSPAASRSRASGRSASPDSHQLSAATRRTPASPIRSSRLRSSAIRASDSSRLTPTSTSVPGTTSRVSVRNFDPSVVTVRSPGFSASVRPLGTLTPLAA